MPPVLRENQDLVSYRKLVEQMFDEQSIELISNKDTTHAQIIIETMASRAKKSLDFLSLKLCEKLYDSPEVSSKIMAASMRGVKVRMLSQEEMEAKVLKDFSLIVGGGSAIQFRKAIKDSFVNEAPYNFVVMDGKAFRFEEDKSSHSATASANNPDLCRQMLDMFERMWDASVPV
jgi:hypothetical protein